LIELNGTNISHQIACDNKRAWPSEWTENVDGWAGWWMWMGEHIYPVIPVLTVFRQEQQLTHFELDMFYMSVSRAFARQ